MKLRSSFACLAALLLTAVANAADEPLLKVSTPEKTLTLTAAEFAALPHTETTVPDPHTKADRHFAGVALRELLTRVGAPLGEKMRGPSLQLAVLFRAKDGYAVIFALSEFDEALGNRALLLADSEDGKPLADKAAPLELIVPGDKKAARWARMVTSIEIVSVGTVVPKTAAAH